MRCLYESGDEAVTALTSASEIAALVRLFATIAGEEGWQPADQLDAHAGASLYFALSVGDVLAGGLQLLPGQRMRLLPCFDVWPELLERDVSHVAHVPILALLKEYRGRAEHFWSLGVEMWRWCVCEGITQVWLEATPRTLQVYRRIGWPLEIVGDLRPHWGEDCYLCAMGTGELASVLITKAARSGLHRRLVRQGVRAGADELCCAGRGEQFPALRPSG